MQWLVRAGLVVAMLGMAACASQSTLSEQDDVGVTKEGEQVIAERDDEANAVARESERDEKPDRVCERVKRTGSHMTETYCYSPREAQRSRDKAREAVRRETERARAGGDR